MNILASIYEIMGEKEKAKIIHRQILIDNPNNIYSENSLRRLADKKKYNAEKINKEILNCFINSNKDDKENLNKLERWLIGD